MANGYLPRKLKGSDLALFAVLRSLRLRVKVLPVLQGEKSEKEGWKYFVGNDCGLETSSIAQRTGGIKAFRAGTYNYHDTDLDIELYREKGYMEKEVYENGWKTAQRAFELRYTYTAHDLVSYDDINERWKRILVTRHPTGSSKESVGAMIGTALHPYVLTDRCNEDGTDEVRCPSKYYGFFFFFSSARSFGLRDSTNHRTA